MKCEECSEQVRVPRHRWASFHFCSRRCGALSKRTHITANCANCGTQFEHISSRCNTAKYCSVSCYYESMKGRGSVELTCVVCKNTFRRPPSRAIYRSPVCDKVCRGILSRSAAPGSPYSARQWLHRRGRLTKCEECGYCKHPEILAVHHKDGNRSNNAIDNLVILCPNCHAIEHYVSHP